MDAYLFEADLLCAPCAEATREGFKTAPGWGFDDSDGGQMWRAPSGECFDAQGNVLEPGTEQPLGTSTDTFPAGPHADGSGESDSPQNCCACGVFLENPLTADGDQYVAGKCLEAMERPDMRAGEKGRNLKESVVLTVWWPFYRDGMPRLLRAAVGLKLAQMGMGMEGPLSNVGPFELEEAADEAANLLCGAWEKERRGGRSSLGPVGTVG